MIIASTRALPLLEVPADENELLTITENPEPSSTFPNLTGVDYDDILLISSNPSTVLPPSISTATGAGIISQYQELNPNGDYKFGYYILITYKVLSENY